MLCLFSSPQALGDFLGSDPGREYSLRRKESIAPFLRRHGAVLEQVVVDPTGRHAMSFQADELLEILDTSPPADDPTGLFDETGTGISGEALHALGTVEDPGGFRGIGIELNLPDHWAVIEVDDHEARDKQIRELVKVQTRKLSDASAPLRRDLREKLLDAAIKAESAGGQVMAYLVLPGDTAALALHLTLYWHDLGPVPADGTHLHNVRSRLESNHEPGLGDVLTWTDTLSGPFLRDVRQRRGAEEVGGQDVPLLLIDYWAEAPGKQSIARLAFSTPHVGIRDEMLRLTDKVLFSTEWILGRPSDDTPADTAREPDPTRPEPAAPAPAAPSPTGV
ncbi:hypothetical protein [Myceligenerans indicum]|uniref:Uncharacterized protein n=1 Tax=Myceligenerans indicum TaxID=2593663 RepID=A0ABS1LH10_9MICO|nr:hypothetical protein [Myceligenerans indicum]MBL0885433.1 hypothetical protein [Myceligenerans indicum]